MISAKGLRGKKPKEWKIQVLRSQSCYSHSTPQPQATSCSTWNSELSSVGAEKSDCFFACSTVPAAQCIMLDCMKVFNVNQYFHYSDHSYLNSYSTGDGNGTDTLSTNAKSMCKYTDWCMTAREKEIALKSTLKMYILVFILCQKWVRNWEVTDRSAFVLLYTGQGFSCSEVTVTALWAVQGRLTDCSAEAHLQKFHGK